MMKLIFLRKKEIYLNRNLTNQLYNFNKGKKNLVKE